MKRVGDACPFVSKVEKVVTLLESSQDPFKLSNDRKLYKFKFSPPVGKAAGHPLYQRRMQMGPPAHAASDPMCSLALHMSMNSLFSGWNAP